MTDIIVIAVIVLIIGSATAYLIKAKKRGVKCIGCPSGCNCSSKKDTSDTDGGCACCHGCTSENDTESCCHGSTRKEQ